MYLLQDWTRWSHPGIGVGRCGQYGHDVQRQLIAGAQLEEIFGDEFAVLHAQVGEKFVVVVFPVNHAIRRKRHRIHRIFYADIV